MCVCVCMYITNDDDHRIVLVHSALLYRIICYFLCTLKLWRVALTLAASRFGALARLGNQFSLTYRVNVD